MLTGRGVRVGVIAGLGIDTGREEVGGAEVIGVGGVTVSKARRFLVV
jgi:hypothetical protein